MEQVKQFLKSRTIWGGLILVTQVVLGPEIGNAVSGVVSAVEAGTVNGMVTAIGAAMVVIGRAWAKPILAR